jgi:hypothetical protein
MAIVAAIQAAQRNGTRFTAQIVGIAASMASAVACACDVVEIAPNGLFHLHNPHTQATGDAGQLRQTADQLEAHAGALVSLYQRSGQTADQVRKLMAADSYLTAAKAVSLGFADRLMQTNTMRRRAPETEALALAPESLYQSFEAMPENPENPTMPFMQRLRRVLQMGDDATEEQLLEAVRKLANGQGDGNGDDATAQVLALAKQHNLVPAQNWQAFEALARSGDLETAKTLMQGTAGQAAPPEAKPGPAQQSAMAWFQANAGPQTPNESPDAARARFEWYRENAPETLQNNPEWAKELKAQAYPSK